MAHSLEPVSSRTALILDGERSRRARLAAHLREQDWTATEAATVLEGIVELLDPRPPNARIVVVFLASSLSSTSGEGFAEFLAGMDPSIQPVLMAPAHARRHPWVSSNAHPEYLTVPWTLVDLQRVLHRVAMRVAMRVSGRAYAQLAALGHGPATRSPADLAPSMAPVTSRGERSGIKPYDRYPTPRSAAWWRTPPTNVPRH